MNSKFNTASKVSIIASVIGTLGGIVLMSFPSPPVPRIFGYVGCIGACISYVLLITHIWIRFTIQDRNGEQK